MAIKTFNPNRTVGGTFSLVRAADGTYSVKENGFESLGVLNLPELSDSAVTTTATKTDTATDITDTTVEDQTKKAFELPKSDDNNNQFTTEKMLKSATDVSKSLSDFETVSDKQKEESQLGLGKDRVNPFRDIDTGVDQFTGTGIRAPDRIFRSDTERFKTEFDPTVTSPQEKLKVTSANVQKGLVEAPLKKDLTDLYNKYVAGDKTKIDTEKGSEVVQGGKPGMLGDKGVSMDKMSGALGIKADPSAVELGEMKTTAPFPGRSRTIGGLKVEAPAPLAIDEGAVQLGEMNTTTAKRTFSESLNAAFQNSPMMTIMREIGRPVNEGEGTTAFNKGKFNIATSSGAMQGRIVGDDGVYDPANNLFHGMNRSSKFGNLEKAGQKRIDTLNKTLERQAKKGKQSQTLIDRRDKFEKELTEYRNEKNVSNINSAKKKGIDTTKLNPNEMRNVAESGDPGGTGGGKSIVCTAMYQTTGLQDWAKAMKIWYIYQKRYLTMQHQEGYHKLFKPFVKGMHKSNIIKAIGAHFAKHRTQHLKHIMFNSKPSLLGKIYNKILEPICYWAGKK